MSHGPAPDPFDLFVGRHSQRGLIAKGVAESRGGRPWLMVVRGAPGTGKTALLRHTVRSLTGFTVLNAACDASEQHLPYEVVHQLLARVPAELLDRWPGLAAPIAASAPPARVGADLLRLVLDLQARSGPVALVIDDADWADEHSVLALGGLLRRLFHDRVFTIVTAGAESELATRIAAAHRLCCELQVAGLSRQELGELLCALHGRPVAADVVAWLHDYTGGHPRYTRLLVTETDLDLDGAGNAVSRLPSALPVSLLGAVRTRLSALPGPARDLVEAVTVLAQRCTLALAAQVGGVLDPADALEPALAAGLLGWWPSDPSSPIEVRHPLLREAIYHLITPRRRGALHRAAAGLVDRNAGWRHRLAAADGVDPELASELERAAGRVLGHHEPGGGEVDRAATYLRWAADVSDTYQERERRLLTAAVHLLWWHRREGVEQLLPAVHAATPSALRGCALGLLALSHADLPTARTTLAEALETIDPPAPTWLAARLHVALAATHLAQGNGRLAAWHAAQAAADEHAEPPVREAAAQASGLGHLLSGGPRTALGHPLALTGRSLCHQLSGELVAAARDATAATQTPDPGLPHHGAELAPLTLAMAQYLLGAWKEASANIERSARLADQGPMDVPVSAIAVLLAAGTGEWPAAQQHLDRIQEHPARGMNEQHTVFLGIANAGVGQAKRDYRSMVRAFEGLRGMVRADGLTGRLRALRPWWLPMLAEGLVGSDAVPDVKSTLDDLAELAEDVPYLRLTHLWLSAWRAHRRGDHRGARALYERGVALPVGPNDVPLHRARLEQAYGQLLHELRDRRNASRWLRRAHARYAELGAAPFLDDCAANLVACGPQAGVLRDTPSLTEREREVAQLAAGGMTNHEAATRLYVSEKTVEYHLGNVYAKLGLTSRRQLRNHPALAVS